MKYLLHFCFEISYKYKELLGGYTMGNSRVDVRSTKQKVKKFVRYKEGAEMYSMCQSKFERMAREAKATYKLDKLVLVNTELFEKYLETFRIVE